MHVGNICRMDLINIVYCQVQSSADDSERPVALLHLQQPTRFQVVESAGNARKNQRRE